MNDPVPMPARKRSLIDLNSLENDLNQEAKRQRNIPSLEELGRAGAQAVLKQHEDAAKQLENLGVETREHIAKLEAAIAERHKDLQLITDGIAAIRDRGKSIELLITDAALFSQDVRDIVQAVTQKVRE